MPAFTPVNQRLQSMNHPGTMSTKLSALSADTYKAMEKRKQVKTKQRKDTSTLEDVNSWFGVIGSFVGGVGSAMGM